MRKICAWCKKNMETIPSIRKSDTIISHGICAECVEKAFAQQRMGGLTPFFENVGVPLAVVEMERKTS